MKHILIVIITAFISIAIHAQDSQLTYSIEFKDVEKYDNITQVGKYLTGALNTFGTQHHVFGEGSKSFVWMEYLGYKTVLLKKLDIIKRNSNLYEVTFRGIIFEGLKKSLNILAKSAHESEDLESKGTIIQLLLSSNATKKTIAPKVKNVTITSKHGSFDPSKYESGQQVQVYYWYGDKYLTIKHTSKDGIRDVETAIHTNPRKTTVSDGGEYWGNDKLAWDRYMTSQGFKIVDSYKTDVDHGYRGTANTNYTSTGYGLNKNTSVSVSNYTRTARTTIYVKI